MGKHTSGDTSIHQSHGRQDRQDAIRQREIYDDSLLPSPEDLERYQKIDSKLPDWLMERAKIEQENRISIQAEQVELVKNDQKIQSKLGNQALWFAFIIMVLGMSLSATLIYLKESTIGTIFGGVTIVIAVVSFLNFRSQRKA